MNWQQLLTIKRANSSCNYNSSKKYIKEHVRSPFLRDVDKITFSSYFRKLQDKTQVHPLAKNSYVRTRLTHSLEVATVGRSLGVIVGNEIINRNNELKVKDYDSNIDHTITRYDFAYIVQAACLAHDIGNPPFGHKGEDVISSFYAKLFGDITLKKDIISKQQQNDLTHFDGNAQGFRIIANTADYTEKHLGLNLTYPVLATFCKYPSFIINKNLLHAKKIGVFNSEQAILHDIIKELNLLAEANYDNQIFKRHPLTFLVEAADDICYCVADIQDALSVGILTFAEVETIFKQFLFSQETTNFYSNINNKYPYSFVQNLAQDTLDKARSKYIELSSTYNLKPIFLIEHLASEIINILIYAVAIQFLENEHRLLQGEFNSPLLNETPFHNYINETFSLNNITMTGLRKTAQDKIYTYKEKSKQELSGMAAIQNILTEFTNIALAFEEEKATKQLKLTTKEQMLHRVYLDNKLNINNSLYTNLQLINDFIVNSTDKNIIDIYHTINAFN
ncbi:dGTP triphosphohydrolase [Rickettsiales bacterium LUAb2]